MVKRLSLFLLLLPVMPFLINSCQDCEDCGPLLREATVNLRFINQDSLDAVQAELLVVDASIETITASLSILSDSLSFYRDSLNSVDLQIAGGTEGLDDLRATLNQKVADLDTTFSQFQELSIEENQKLTDLNIIQSDITSGKVFIDSLLSKNNFAIADFGPDSLTNFLFPLSINEDSTAYRVFIGDQFFDLTLQYIRTFEEDERSQIEVVVSNVEIRDGYTFRQVEINCEECVSNETTITAYF